MGSPKQTESSKRMESPKQSDASSSKRKAVEDCPGKDPKAPRVAWEHGPSSSSGGHNYDSCTPQPNLAENCFNYLKSGVPCRIMFYRRGAWSNFPAQITQALVEAFRGNKSSTVVVMDDQPVLVDFLSMTLVNLSTRKQRSVGWFDENEKSFFPSWFFDEEAADASPESSIIDGSVDGVPVENKLAISPPEVVKQVVLESGPPLLQKPSVGDVLRKKIRLVEKGSESFLFVQKLFLSGMGPFATPDNILHIHRYAPNDITSQCRLEAFERQTKSTKEERGNANVRYGWLGSRKLDIVKILIQGFSMAGKPTEGAGLGTGTFLSPEDRAFASVNLCDVDEKGVQYMLLCRAILGNMETVKPGSQDYFPSSQTYDSGTDDCLNPRYYVVGPSNLTTHIRLEYLVSFKLSPRARDYLLGLKGLWFHASPAKEVINDLSTLDPVKFDSVRGPTSPWISFKALFGTIEDEISPMAKELLNYHHEELKKNKITREEMVKKVMVIVGEKLLAEALKKIHYCPSMWYKSSAVDGEKAIYPSKTTTSAEPSCLAAGTNLDAASLSLEVMALDDPVESTEHSNSNRVSTGTKLDTSISLSTKRADSVSSEDLMSVDPVERSREPNKSSGPVTTGSKSLSAKSGNSVPAKRANSGPLEERKENNKLLKLASVASWTKEGIASVVSLPTMPANNSVSSGGVMSANPAEQKKVIKLGGLAPTTKLNAPSLTLSSKSSDSVSSKSKISADPVGPRNDSNNKFTRPAAATKLDTSKFSSTKRGDPISSKMMMSGDPIEQSREHNKLIKLALESSSSIAQVVNAHRSTSALQEKCS